MNKHTAALLEQHFDIAFASLEGVTRLRELILTLAMQGKLVEQDHKDQPASELLEEIKRTRRHEGTKGRKRKELPPVSAEEMPYELPESWEWVRLGSLFFIVYGKGLPISKLTASGYDVFGANGIIGKYTEYRYEHPQLLISCRGAYSGKPNISPPKCFVTSNSLILESSWNFLELRYIFYALEIADKEKIVTGSAQPQVTTTNLEPFAIPLPPLAEQQRIVAKIDELMARCDALEALHQQHEEKRLQVHTAAIHQLLEPNLGGFVSSCEPFDFLAKHFSELYSVPENVTELRKAILQLAVMGRLVPQNPDDPPASQLLEEIRTEKKRLIAEGKIKKQKPLPAIKPEEIPYEIPESWEWVRLGFVSEIIGGYAYKSHGFKKQGNHQVIRIGNVKQGLIRFGENPVYIEEDQALQTEAFEALESDILITMTGTRDKKDYLYTAVVGNVPLNIKKIYLNQRVGSIRAQRLVDYLDKALKVDFLRDMIFSTATGSANQANIGISTLREWLVPLPPFPEQKHIVAKIDQLMNLCDQLDEQITARTAKQTELLNAVMGQV